MTRRARCARSTPGPGTRSGRRPSRASRTWETRPTASTDDRTTCSAPRGRPRSGDRRLPGGRLVAADRLRRRHPARPRRSPPPCGCGRSTSRPARRCWTEPLGGRRVRRRRRHRRGRRGGPGSADGPARAWCGSTRRRGRERWSVDVPRPADGAGWEYPIRAAVRRRDRRRLARDHDPVHRRRRAGRASSTPTTCGSSAGTASRPWATGITQLRDLDTGRVLDLGDARPPWIATDDGSVPDLLVLQSEDRLTGRDLRHRATRRGASTGRRSGR